MEIAFLAGMKTIRPAGSQEHLPRKNLGPTPADTASLLLADTPRRVESDQARSGDSAEVWKAMASRDGLP